MPQGSSAVRPTNGLYISLMAESSTMCATGTLAGIVQVLLRLEDRGIAVLFLRGLKFFCSPKHPDRFWGPSNGFRGLYPLPVPRLRIRESFLLNKDQQDALSFLNLFQ